MADLSTVKARNQFADLINRVAYSKERVILTRRGKALVAVVHFEDLQQSNATETKAILELPMPNPSSNACIVSNESAAFAVIRG
ncbi:type II toxin-antitoxin system Phd/YefM family antitoxin [Nostoc sp. CHAB 5824]|nr:type II toxin-antitoxin system Phd/YefM family antitoxin [Nostoc sp. CHAB 5824]